MKNFITENDIKNAIETARSILADESASPTARLTAARTLLNFSTKTPPPTKPRTALERALEELTPDCDD